MEIVSYKHTNYDESWTFVFDDGRVVTLRKAGLEHAKRLLLLAELRVAAWKYVIAKGGRL